MPVYTKSQGGKAILGDLKQKLDMVQANINASAARQDWPNEYRRKMRQEAVALARSLVDEARLAFAEWARDKTNEAVATWNADPVGSPAEESRRAANEAKLARLIEAGRSAQIQVVAGQVVRNPKAAEYAAQAQALYMAGGRHDEAVVFADAAIALGAESAANLRELAASQAKLKDPDKAGAYRDVAQVRSLTLDFERIVSGSMTRALATAAEAARSIGDDGYGYDREATRLSLSAKAAAWAQSASSGEPYTNPEGALDAERVLLAQTALGKPSE